MSTLGTLVANSLWFAFDTLDHHKTGFVPKSQLKVLTQNISVLLKIDRRVEESLKDFFSYKELNFEQFLDFLSIEVFPEVDNNAPRYKDLKQFHRDLETIFWDLSRPSFGVRVQPVLSDVSLFKIYRIFCLLADRSPDYEYLVQVTMTKGEAEEVTRRLIIELGREFDQQDFRQLAESIPPFTLPVLATFLEGRYLQEVEPPALELAIEEIYQVFVEQVLEKGKIYHRLPLTPLWVVRDVILYPWELRPVKPAPSLLQPLQERFASAPLATLTPSSEMAGVRDHPGMKKCQFMIKNKKVVELAAMDYRAKTRWLRALDEAVPNSDNSLPYQMILSQQRKELRMFEEVREVEEKFRRDSQADIIDQTQAELVSERLARVEAEAKREEEALARASGEKRVKELTTLRQQLEDLLEQETQAKRDEEIVRNLQARVLREEWEKREELELLQKEQRVLLDAEQKKREAFERVHQEKEEQLKEAQGKLRKLEIERFKLDHDLSSAREKIVKSERGQEIVEARMKVKQRKPPERAFSLRPPRRDHPPRTAPLRSSSFNTKNSIRKTFFPRSETKKSNGDVDFLKSDSPVPIRPLRREISHSTQLKSPSPNFLQKNPMETLEKSNQHTGDSLNTTASHTSQEDIDSDTLNESKDSGNFHNSSERIPQQPNIVKANIVISVENYESCESINTNHSIPCCEVSEDSKNEEYDGNCNESMNENGIDGDSEENSKGYIEIRGYTGS